MADTHVVVTKQVENGATFASAEALAGAARVDEVARMLSGNEAGDSARLHAAELLGHRAKAGHP